jgi:hypothetical protein
MSPDAEAEELVGCTADERLAEVPSDLPISLGRPHTMPLSRTRGRVVGLGATLTGVTLITGVILIVLGLISAISSGLDLLGIVALALGALLAATHWGWVHVAEATADAIEHRRSDQIAAEHARWLATIEPYARYEVTTTVADDGSITIHRVEHRPIRSGELHFTFVRQTDSGELHSGDEAAATVAERAELLRRQAAADTERARQRFELAADAHERALLGELDDQHQLSVRRAGSQALSEQINSNLREPPLIE